MNAIDDRLILLEHRRQMIQMLSLSVGGLILAGFGLVAYAVDHGHNRLLLGWVAIGVVLGVGAQLKFLRQVTRNKDKGIA